MAFFAVPSVAGGACQHDSGERRHREDGAAGDKHDDRAPRPLACEGELALGDESERHSASLWLRTVDLKDAAHGQAFPARRTGRCTWSPSRLSSSSALAMVEPRRMFLDRSEGVRPDACGNGGARRVRERLEHHVEQVVRFAPSQTSCGAPASAAEAASRFDARRHRPCRLAGPDALAPQWRAEREMDLHQRRLPAEAASAHCADARRAEGQRSADAPRSLDPRGRNRLHHRSCSVRSQNASGRMPSEQSQHRRPHSDRGGPRRGVRLDTPSLPTWARSRVRTGPRR